MALATMTSKGQVTIPGIVREKLHLHAGDKIDFTLIDDVFGCLHHAAGGKKASVADMDAAIRQKVQQAKGS